MSKTFEVSIPVFRNMFVYSIIIISLVTVLPFIFTWGTLFIISFEGNWYYVPSIVIGLYIALSILGEMARMMFDPVITAYDLSKRCPELLELRESAGTDTKIRHPDFVWILLANLLSLVFPPIWLGVMYWSYNPGKVHLPSDYTEALESA